jgi:hypothetical protein
LPDHITVGIGIVADVAQGLLNKKPWVLDGFLVVFAKTFQELRHIGLLTAGEFNNDQVIARFIACHQRYAGAIRCDRCAKIIIKRIRKNLRQEAPIGVTDPNPIFAAIKDVRSIGVERFGSGVSRVALALAVPGCSWVAGGLHLAY